MSAHTWVLMLTNRAYDGLDVSVTVDAGEDSKGSAIFVDSDADAGKSQALSEDCKGFCHPSLVGASTCSAQRFVVAPAMATVAASATTSIADTAIAMAPLLGGFG